MLNYTNISMLKKATIKPETKPVNTSFKLWAPANNRDDIIKPESNTIKLNK